SKRAAALKDENRIQDLHSLSSNRDILESCNVTLLNFSEGRSFATTSLAVAFSFFIICSVINWTASVLLSLVGFDDEHALSAEQFQRFDPLRKIGHFVFKCGDRSREINALRSPLPSPVRLCRSIVENAEALNNRLQRLILLELNIGVRLERQDSILDVEGRWRLPANLDAGDVVDATLRL